MFCPQMTVSHGCSVDCHQAVRRTMVAEWLLREGTRSRKRSSTRWRGEIGKFGSRSGLGHCKAGTARGTWGNPSFCSGWSDDDDESISGALVVQEGWRKKNGMQGLPPCINESVPKLCNQPSLFPRAERTVLQARFLTGLGQSVHRWTGPKRINGPAPKVHNWCAMPCMHPSSSGTLHFCAPPHPPAHNFCCCTRGNTLLFRWGNKDNVSCFFLPSVVFIHTVRPCFSRCEYSSFMLVSCYRFFSLLIVHSLLTRVCHFASGVPPFSQ